MSGIRPAIVSKGRQSQPTTVRRGDSGSYSWNDLHSSIGIAHWPSPPYRDGYGIAEVKPMNNCAARCKPRCVSVEGFTYHAIQACS